jgi:glutaredoxin 2
MRTPSKSILIEKYINERVGQEVKPDQIAQAIECTIQSVYLFIRKNPQRFSKVTRGTFKINAANNQVFSNNEGTI